MPNSKSRAFSFRDMENIFRTRRFPFPKRSIEFIALIAVSCTFFLFMHTKNLNSRLHEMEIKMQPSELSALGLTGSNSISNDGSRASKGLHGTYQYLKSTGQLDKINSDLLNNTKKSTVDIIVYNAVNRVGSQQLIKLIEHLSELNDFTVFKDLSNTPIVQQISSRESEEEDVIAITDGIIGPIVYIDNSNWINFTNYNSPKPIYINMIQDPIERIHSWYYYLRDPNANLKRNLKDLKSRKWYETNFNDCIRKEMEGCTYISYSMDNYEDFPRQSLFFCGNNIDCMPLNSELAIQTAKHNVENDYAVIGTWDETNITLKVFEKFLPKYFKGALPIYYAFAEKPLKNPFKGKIEHDVIEILMKKFSYEIDFYNFCKQRLYKQFLSITNINFV